MATKYRCVAFNDAGEATYTGRVNVLGPPSLRPSWLSSSSSQTNINNNTLTVVSGRSITLRCSVIAYPIESILWQHNGNTLPVNHRQKVDLIVNGVGGKLHINNVHRSADQGEYWCIVKVCPHFLKEFLLFKKFFVRTSMYLKAGIIKPLIYDQSIIC
jgi:hypothetical protein